VFSEVGEQGEGRAPVGRYLLRALSNTTTPPTNGNSPTANNTVLRVPSAMMAATTLMISPRTSIAMPNDVSRSLSYRRGSPAPEH
jgi:hypothetical protein